jgi:hypothetical protein
MTSPYPSAWRLRILELILLALWKRPRHRKSKLAASIDREYLIPTGAKPFAHRSLMLTTAHNATDACEGFDTLDSDSAILL